MRRRPGIVVSIADDAYDGNTESEVWSLSKVHVRRLYRRWYMIHILLLDTDSSLWLPALTCITALVLLYHHHRTASGNFRVQKGVDWTKVPPITLTLTQIIDADRRGNRLEKNCFFLSPACHSLILCASHSDHHFYPPISCSRWWNTISNYLYINSLKKPAIRMSRLMSLSLLLRPAASAISRRMQSSEYESCDHNLTCF